MEFVQDNRREFMQACAMDLKLRPGLGASATASPLVVTPIDPPSLAPALKDVIVPSTYAGHRPAAGEDGAERAAIPDGQSSADAAAYFIRTRLGGKAKVCMRDTLRTLPGVTIVADVSPATVDKEGGYRTMKTILLGQPNIDVVLGADTVVLGPQAALLDAGKARLDAHQQQHCGL